MLYVFMFIYEILCSYLSVCVNACTSLCASANVCVCVYVICACACSCLFCVTLSVHLCSAMSLPVHVCLYVCVCVHPCKKGFGQHCLHFFKGWPFFDNKCYGADASTCGQRLAYVLNYVQYYVH